MTNGFKLIGISVRTTNKNQQSQNDLSKLWKHFFADNLFDKISNKLSNEIIVVYTDYKSDYTDGYTVMIGYRVSHLNEIPNSLTGRTFKPDTFQKFSAEGEMPKAVINTWQKIWRNDKKLNRKYSYDFEVYGEDSQKGENSKVEIYIAVESKP